VGADDPLTVLTVWSSGRQSCPWIGSPDSPLAPAYGNPLDSQDSRSGLELVSPETRTRGSGV